MCEFGRADAEAPFVTAVRDTVMLCALFETAFRDTVMLFAPFAIDTGPRAEAWALPDAIALGAMALSASVATEMNITSLLFMVCSSFVSLFPALSSPLVRANSLRDGASVRQLARDANALAVI